MSPFYRMQRAPCARSSRCVSPPHACPAQQAQTLALLVRDISASPLLQTASVGLAPVGEVAWITALWAALGVFVAWMTRLEGRVPLRFFRASRVSAAGNPPHRDAPTRSSDALCLPTSTQISGPQSNWWRASPGPTSKPQGPSFPILLVNNAVMLLIFSQAWRPRPCSRPRPRRTRHP